MDADVASASRMSTSGRASTSGSSASTAASRAGSESLEERERKVRLLLLTLNEPYPGPQGLRLASLPGPAPSRNVPCDYCRRRGRVKQRTGTRLCPVCDGRGWRGKRSHEPAWDEYVELPVADAVLLPTMSIPPTADPVKAGQSYGWERQVSSYRRHGSYRELERALSLLRGQWPAGYATIRAIYLRDVTVALRGVDRGREQRAVTLLAAEMRGRIRVPPWVMEEASRDRRDSAHSLRAQGIKPGAIARILGISREKVKRLLKGAPSDAPVTIPTGRSRRARREP